MTTEPNTPSPDAPQATTSAVHAHAGEPVQFHMVMQRLRSLARVARALLIVQRLGWILAGIVAALVLAGVIDYTLRSPGWMRAAVLLVGIGVLGTTLVRRLWPAIKFRPTESQIAARIERTPAGQSSGLQDLLTSAVELSRDRQNDGPLSRALASPVIEDAARRLMAADTRSVLRPGPALLSAGIAGAGILAIVLTGVLSPMWAAISLRRTLTPWADVQWPKRTVLADVTGATVHPLGTALPVRAALVRSPRAADETNVTVHYRILTPEASGGTVNTGELTSQSRTVDAIAPQADGTPGPATGVLMERLIDPYRMIQSSAAISGATPPPGADMTAARSGSKPALTLPDQNVLEYWFTSGDDQTPVARVRLIDPPAIIAASASIKPPAYLTGPSASTSPRVVDLGTGTDGRAVLSDVIAGSELTLTLTFNKDLPTPRQSELERSLGAEFAGAIREASDKATTRLDRSAWTFTLPVRASFTLRPSLRDGFGVASTDDMAFRVEALTDQPPQASITLPARDEDVLPDALVDVAGEARDDFGLGALTLESQIAKRPGDSAGAPPEPTGPATEITRTTPTQASTSATPPGADQPTSTTKTTQPVTPPLTATARVALKDLNVAPGDEVWLSALATDTFSLDGQTHAPVRSTIRRLRVISREQLVEQLFSQLDTVRRQAERAEDEQRKLAQQQPRTTTSDQTASQQSAISEQIQQMRQSLRDVAAKAETAKRGQNPADRELDEVLRAAERAAEQAASASRDAQRSIADAKAAEQANDQNAQQAADQSAQKSQAESASRLGQLAQSLDRGRDAFAQRRRTQQLLSDQQELRRQTGELSRQTAGKSAEQLTPEQRAQSARLAQEQESLASRAEELLRSLKDKAEELATSDPAASESLKQAAQTGEQRALVQQQQQAARQIQQAQQQQAQQQQQRAEQALNQMLQQLNESQRQRDAVLRRQLDSLVQTLEALVTRQEGELAALEQRAGASAGFDGLDAPLIQLRTATLAASEEARALDEQSRAAPDQDAPKLTDLILQAAARQASAIGALRATPVDVPTARTGETDALGLLRDALEAAKAAQEQSKQEEERQARAELRKAYQESLEAQRALITRATETLSAAADRRQRAGARAIADEQDALATTLSDLKRANQELTESPVFSLAHEIIDASSARASAALRETTLARVILVSQQSVEETLVALVAALDDASKPDEFREQEQGEQQGGDQQGPPQKPPLLPPLTQLKALRELQAGALRFTKQASAAGLDANVARELTDQATRVQKRLSEEAQSVIDSLKQNGGGQ